MDGLRAPVGGQAPEVYWRRRIVAATGIVIALVVVYFLAFSPGGDSKKSPTNSPTATPTISTTHSASPTVSANPTVAASGAPSRPCTAADVKLTVTPNPHDFAAGALPVFDVDIKQSAASPCMLDTAATGTELKITSGKDRIFSSTDCPADATITAKQFLLQAGASQTFQVTWNRQRSAPQCTTVSASPKAGTYHAQLTVQGIAANDASFGLTG